jgi:CHAD domain-containing protein
MRHNFGGKCQEVMKNKDFKEEAEHRMKKATECFKKLHADFDSEDIHDFRVEMKKVRALLRLADFGSKRKKKIKLPKKLKEFYKTVGDIRSLQLHAKKINDTASAELDPPPDLYLKLLEGRKEINIGKAKQKRKQLKGIKKDMDKLLRRIPKGINAGSTRDFTDYELGRLEVIQVKAFPTDQELHEVRKIMKDILYNWSYIEPLSKDILPSAIQEKAGMEGFVDRLGDYHDDAVSLNMFHDLTIEQSVDGKEQSELRRIARKWKDEKDQLHEEIMVGLKKISANGQPNRD